MQPLAHTYPQVGEAIHQALLDLGGSNPDGGVQTILEALVEVSAPPERMPALFALGQRRLEQQELLAIPNPTGYLIGIMRTLAVEAMLKGWKVDQMWADDEEKHAQALRAVHRGEAREFIGESETCPAAEEVGQDAGPAVPGGQSGEHFAEKPDERSTAGAEAPAQAEEETAEKVDATWLECLRPTISGRDGKERSVAMYWAFARDAILANPTLSQARKWHLHGIQACAIDPAQPRTLFLLCTSGTAARCIESSLRREIAEQREKLLWREFDAVQIEVVPRLPPWVVQQEESS